MRPAQGYNSCHPCSCRVPAAQVRTQLTRSNLLFGEEQSYVRTTQNTPRSYNRLTLDDRYQPETGHIQRANSTLQHSPIQIPSMSTLRFSLQVLGVFAAQREARDERLRRTDDPDVIAGRLITSARQDQGGAGRLDLTPVRMVFGASSRRLRFTPTKSPFFSLRFKLQMSQKAFDSETARFGAILVEPAQRRSHNFPHRSTHIPTAAILSEFAPRTLYNAFLKANGRSQPPSDRWCGCRSPSAAPAFPARLTMDFKLRKLRAGAV